MPRNPYSSLSNDQLKILNYDQGAIVVKACPGSGKTHSVAARISKLLSAERLNRKGIAALSFTNVACDKIDMKLKEEFDVKNFCRHPHFLGTLDRFINHYVFLPYGHLVMGCSSRPELVGLPYSNWTKGKGDRTYTFANGQRRCVSANPDGYFDSVTFDIDDMLIPIVPPREIHFSLKRETYFNQNGKPAKRIQDLINSKLANFKLGFANQSDANYLSLKVLTGYPKIAENIANQFEYFIIDEAQDTDEIQMKIIEILNQCGAKNIMLVGDRDQSIFEWNNAKPELFDAKYNQWDKIDLVENRRSSQNICNFITPLSSFDKIISINEEVQHYDFDPEILGFKWPKKNVVTFEQSKAGFVKIMSRFMAICEQNSIKVNKSSVAVLYRGKSNSPYLDVKQDFDEFDSLPWMKGNYHVKDILKGAFLYDNGQFTIGYKFMERGLIEALEKINDSNFHCTSTFISASISRHGLINHRKNIFEIIKLFPSTRDRKLSAWINEANDSLTKNNLGFQLNVQMSKSHLPIEDLFAGDLPSTTIHPFFYGTIHSAKGKSFDAVLLLLGKKPGNSSNYSTMLKNGAKGDDLEEIRNIYVAISRPRKVLIVATPEEDVELWTQKLKSRLM